MGSAEAWQIGNCSVHPGKANGSAVSHLVQGKASKTKCFLDELPLKQEHLPPGFKTLSLFNLEESGSGRMWQDSNLGYPWPAKQRTHRGTCSRSHQLPSACCKFLHGRKRQGELSCKWKAVQWTQRGWRRRPARSEDHPSQTQHTSPCIFGLLFFSSCLSSVSPHQPMLLCNS